MFFIVRLIAVLVFVFYCPGAFACDIPKSVTIPNGKTATEREMIVAGRAMERYFDQFERYTDCVESDTKARRKSGVKRDVSSNRLREQEAARKLNEAAADIEDLAERFSKATADYESRKQ